MKKIILAFYQTLKNITKDYMLFISLLAPILMGLAFKFLLPLGESLLCNYFNKRIILSSYYLLFDLLLASLTPVMVSFATAMIILEEIDNGIAKYLTITPLGSRGYLFSKIGLLSLLSIPYDALILLIFSLTQIPLYLIIIISILNSLSGIIIAMFVVAFAKNKVEGLALTKLSSFFILGFLVAFFVKDPISFLAFFLPTFWIGKMVFSRNLFFLLPCVIISLIIIFSLYKKFKNKIFT